MKNLSKLSKPTLIYNENYQQLGDIAEKWPKTTKPGEIISKLIIIMQMMNS